MQRYVERKIPVHRTDASGAVTVRMVPDKAPQVEHFRLQRKRYWIEAPDLANEETVLGRMARYGAIFQMRILPLLLEFRRRV